MRIYIVLLISFFNFNVYSQKPSCLLTEKTTMEPNGKILNKIEIKFDDFKNMVEEKNTTYYENIPSVSKKIINYDTKGQPIKRETYLNEKLIYTDELNYDKEGKLLYENNFTGDLLTKNNQKSKNKIINYNEDGSVYSILKTEKNDFSETKTVYNTKDEILSKEITIYNILGQKVSHEFTEPSYKMSKKTLYNYNKSNQLIKEELSTNNVVNMVLEYEYEGENLVLRKGLNGNGNENFRMEYEFYNGLNNRILIYSYGKLFEIVENKFDKKRNLIEETTSNIQGQVYLITKYKYDCE